MSRPAPRPEVRDPWYQAIIAHPTLTNATKLLLVVLVDDMDPWGRVSVPRSVLAKKLAVHPTRITERVKEATDAKVLHTVVKGRPGTTAEYQAVLPVGAPVRTKRRRRRDPAYGADARTKSGPNMVRPLYQAEVRTSVPSAEREDGAHVQSASSTNSPADTTSPTAVGEKPERNEEGSTSTRVNQYGVGNCVVCSSFEKLGPDDRCSPCAVSAAVRSA